MKVILIFTILGLNKLDMSSEVYVVRRPEHPHIEL